ncbi:MAG: hypothetical protein C4520_18160 [Candidatus Abyssobacteria bacterium SURF_5]|uniref:Uncharacterized protein n=1 Tax=Abyssobacteria bacterium (strain SURF_5) TaxID=2093360 RepID=A0A3A4NHX0_ABYX5|nr:MAG: hypothetical protein C4520_18160 [Candidatus Abyssubacteria bacterium SURF_5]
MLTTFAAKKGRTGAPLGSMRKHSVRIHQAWSYRNVQSKMNAMPLLCLYSCIYKGLQMKSRSGRNEKIVIGNNVHGLFITLSFLSTYG